MQAAQKPAQAAAGGIVHKHTEVELDNLEYFQERLYMSVAQLDELEAFVKSTNATAAAGGTSLASGEGGAGGAGGASGAGGRSAAEDDGGGGGGGDQSVETKDEGAKE